MSSGLARVVKVLDKLTVVLNRGSRDGVDIADKFLIFGMGDEVFDPDTGENLGTIELVRGRVRVTHVQEKVCTAMTNETVKIPGRKRVVERRGMTIMGFPGREEIEEDHSFEDKPLENATVGDYARPY
jgi:hypothetical protein